MSRRTQKKVLAQIIAEKVEQSKKAAEPVLKIEPKQVVKTPLKKGGALKRKTKRRG